MVTIFLAYQVSKIIDGCCWNGMGFYGLVVECITRNGNFSVHIFSVKVVSIHQLIDNEFWGKLQRRSWRENSDRHTINA